MKTNTYIKCPEDIKEQFLEEGKSLAKTIGKMMSSLSLKSQVRGFKQHLAVQIQIQNLKHWYTEHNQRERYKLELREKDQNIAILKQQVEQLKKQIK